MKKKKVLRTLLCCLLLVPTMLMTACPAAVPDPTPSPDPKPGPGDDPTPTPPEPGKDPVYGDGDAVSDTGAVIPEGFATMKIDFTDGGATLSGETLAEKIVSGTLEDYTPMTASGAANVTGLSGVTLDGRFALLSAPDGIVFNGCENITLTNFLVRGGVSFVGCAGVTVNGCYIENADGTALSFDADSTGATVKQAQIGGKTAIANAADGLFVTQSVIRFTETGIADTADAGTTVYHTELNGTGTAIASAARETYIRRNTIDCEGVGISLAITPSFTLSNGFVAENVVKTAACGVALSGQRNTSVILNSVRSIRVTGCHSVYVCENAMGGRLEAADTDYLLADRNVYPSDGQDHTAVQTAVSRRNGDTVTDVNARVEYGANEDLLPHVDKELFVGVPTKTTVRDLDATKEKDLANYINDTARAVENARILIAPGKYNMVRVIDLNGAACDNTDLYAYGVYMERQGSVGGMVSIYNGVKNVTVRGILLATDQQTCGQVYVLEKLGGTLMKVKTGAGMRNDFAATDKSLFVDGWIGAQHAGTFYAYCDANYTGVERKSDGTILLTATATLYENTGIGDVLTCKEVSSGTTIAMEGATNTVFRDVTLYGYAGGFACVENNNLTATTYERLYNTTRTGEIIDKATYDAYVALGEQYGVDFELSIDEQGRYRGSPYHIGSVDATHTSSCGQGSVAISCVFENMCDDATNQNSFHSRLHGYTDNGDGTVTITYKNNLAHVYYNANVRHPNVGTRPFRVGDRVYIYTSTGCLVCDGPALSATVSAGSFNGFVDDKGTSADTPLYSVTVAKENFNAAALNTNGLGAGDTYAHHLTDNTYFDTYKVLVDNMSLASYGLHFENCLMRNIRSRGLLIKASGGTIDHCSFKNIGMSCAAILYEIYWGESGVTETLHVTNNLFDHTGYFSNTTTYAPVSITGLGTKADDDYLLYKDIEVIHNKILNRATTYAIYVNSAKNVTIRDNWIGLMDGEEAAIEDGQNAYSKLIEIVGAKDVMIEGNYFEIVEKGYNDDLAALITGDQYIHVYGADVEDEGEPIFPDCAD